MREDRSIRGHCEESVGRRSNSSQIRRDCFGLWPRNESRLTGLLRSLCSLAITIAFILLTFSAPLFAEFSINGYWKNFFTVIDMPNDSIFPDDLQKPIGAVNNTLRLKLFYEPADWVSFHAAYDISPQFRGPAYSLMDELSVGGVGLDTYRVADFESKIYPESDESSQSLAVFHNLDRLLVSVYLPFADIDIGRQPIAWGTAHVVNPTDIIVPFSYTDLDKEERPGVDAVRIRVPLGVMSELDMGLLPGKDFDTDGDVVLFGRGKFYVMETNISVTAMGIQGDMLAGVDFARAIGGAGVWAEFAIYDVGDIILECECNPLPESSDYTISEWYQRLSFGADYSFNEKTYGFIEYHYNGAGECNPSDYYRNYHKVAYKDAGVYLMGRNYIAPGMVYQITPLMSGSMTGLVNLSDGSAILTPNIEYNLRQDIYISAGANIGFGKGGFESNDDIAGYPPTGQSEFGAYPDIYYTSFRIYF